MGKLTINLCEELHQKIREDVAADESLTTSLLMERIIREHYEGPKPRPRIESGGRTMAFSVSEELFQRVKRYLAAHGGQSQRDFVIGLVTQGLALWEQGKALKMLEGYTPQKGDRTLAFAVTEELFHQIKAYLAAHKKLSQKEFMVSLVENAVSAWEAGAEADGSPIVEVLPELTDAWVDENYGTSDDLHSVEALRAFCQQQLYTSNLNTAVMDDLLENSTFKSIPQQVMDYQVNQCLNYYSTLAGYYGYDLDGLVQNLLGYENTDAMLAREETISSPIMKEDMNKILPIINTSGSDSAMLDNALEFMLILTVSPLEATEVRRPVWKLPQLRATVRMLSASLYA